MRIPRAEGVAVGIWIEGIGAGQFLIPVYHSISSRIRIGIQARRLKLGLPDITAAVSIPVRGICHTQRQCECGAESDAETRFENGQAFLPTRFFELLEG